MSPSRQAHAVSCLVALSALVALGCGSSRERDVVMCGSSVCGASEECCRSCSGGGGSCVPTGSCGACIDAGSAGDDAGPPDAGSTCPPGECRVGAGGACEPPTGPVGNGCCMCTGDMCTSFCMCLASDTPIATPSGDVAVSDLQVGDLVYSVDGPMTVAVPIALTSRTAVSAHRIVRVRLESGVTLRVSARHPTADGRDFGALATGDSLDGVPIVEAEIVDYDGAFTHDILPLSSTGTYYTAGVLIGSTLR